MSLCFCPDVKNENELLLMVNQGKWDKDIYNYLIEIMSEQKNKKLRYKPVELFEMQARLLDDNELLNYEFWDASMSGIYDNKKWKYYMNKIQREIFDIFVLRITEAYESLLKLVESN